MGLEIEKKYLLREGEKTYPAMGFFLLYTSLSELEEKVNRDGTEIIQGYLSIGTGLEIAKRIEKRPEFSPVEARLRNEGGHLYLTLKGEGGTVRPEENYDLTALIFEEYWGKTKGKRVHKKRLDVPYEGHIAQFDVYLDRELVIAEIEFGTIEEIEKLALLGLDVSEMPQYKNKNLAK